MTQSVMQILEAAVAQHQAGRLAEAERLYRAVLQQAPQQPDALNLLGIIAAQQGDLNQAISLFDQAIAAAPQLATVPFNKANTLRDAGRSEEARAAYEAALDVDPNFHDARLNLGVLLQQNDDTEDALRHFNILARLDPKSHPIAQKVHYNIGKCRHSQGRLEEAATALEKALALNPNDPDAHFAIANVHADLRDHQKAVTHINAAIKLKPDWPEAYGNLGNYLCASDQLTEATKHYDTALALDPDNDTVRTNRGLARLALGRLSEGWEDYRHRAKSDAPFYRTLDVNVPCWDGGDLAGKNVLIWNEQGLGEEILYAGLLREFMARVGTGTLLCSDKLKTVFDRSFADISNLRITDEQSFEHGADIFDAQASLVDLGRALRPSMDSFPQATPYLKYDEACASKLRGDLEARFGQSQRFVGLSWSSANPIIGQAKTIPLDLWQPLLSKPGHTFVNAQYGSASHDADALPAPLQGALVSIDSINLNGDLDETLGLLAALDHLVTCSNTTAHLAAAAGLSTKVILPRGAGRIWYWFASETTNPWYSKTDLYRLDETSDIATIMGMVRQHL